MRQGQMRHGCDSVPQRIAQLTLEERIRTARVAALVIGEGAAAGLDRAAGICCEFEKQRFPIGDNPHPILDPRAARYRESARRKPA